MTERGTPLIIANGLHLGYRSSPAVLRDADAEVRAGELLCIIGPNGGGKTTLVRSLAGLLPPRRGSVQLSGVSLYGRHGLDRRERAQTIAVVLTHTVAPAYLRVHELVELGRLPIPAGTAHGWPGRCARPGADRYYAPHRPPGGRAERRRAATRNGRSGAGTGTANSSPR